MMIIGQENVHTSVYESMLCCLKAVIPSVFPFMILSNIISEILTLKENGVAAIFFHKLFGVSSQAVPLIVIGAIAGFPTGAAMCRNLYEKGKISAQEAEYLLSFCTNSGLSLAVGLAGVTVLGSIKSGIVIYIIQIISSLLVGIILKEKHALRLREEAYCIDTKTSFGETIVDSVKKAVKGTAYICGFVTFFSIIAEMVCRYLPEGLIFPAKAVLEITGELSELKDTPRAISFVIANGLLSWSGISAHMQVRSVTHGLKLNKYYLGKVIHMAVSMFLAYPVATSGAVNTFREKIVITNREEGAADGHTAKASPA